MEMVAWAIPGRCPLCGEPAQIEFDDIGANGEPLDTVMMRDVCCTNIGCGFFPPNTTETGQ